MDMNNMKMNGMGGGYMGDMDGFKNIIKDAVADLIEEKQDELLSEIESIVANYTISGDEPTMDYTTESDASDRPTEELENQMTTERLESELESIINSFNEDIDYILSKPLTVELTQIEEIGENIENIKDGLEEINDVFSDIKNLLYDFRDVRDDLKDNIEELKERLS